MADLHRDQIDSKCFLLRVKHQDKKTGRTDMSQGTPFQKDLAEWFKENDYLPHWEAVADKEAKAYIKRMQPRFDPNALPIYEAQALLALSTKGAVYVSEAEATAADLRDHLAVREEVKARHDVAHAKWSRFVRSTLTKFASTTETWADIEKREAVLSDLAASSEVRDHADDLVPV